MELRADFHMVQLMPLPLSLASAKYKLVLPFWYWLTRVVLDKGSLNGHCCYQMIQKAVRYTVGHKKEPTYF